MVIVFHSHPLADTNWKDGGLSIQFFTHIPHALATLSALTIVTRLIPCLAKFTPDFKRALNIDRWYEVLMLRLSSVFACLGLLIWCLYLFELGKGRSPEHGKIWICVETPGVCDVEGRRVIHSGLAGLFLWMLEGALPHVRGIKWVAPDDWIWWIWKLQTRE